ncbi:MAG: uracil-DNA glycosylase family protein [Tannerella sp.]|jgi:G:T/U-mismatch repair DNA glycosylase|nr:uracil-DNA glycosylase family protein [Tannerella sp.]
MNEPLSVESHPLTPFLPENAKLLMLGSFPPQRKRWAMDFYYPNFINDMWRIFGIVFFDNKEHFVDRKNKSFFREEIIQFLTEKGVALFDTATAVRRLNDNASDKFLEVVQPTDIKALLDKIPECKSVAVTGQKATEIFLQQFDVREPAIGDFTDFSCQNRRLQFYRMPSSSRAYPLKLERKAEIYREMFERVLINSGNS